MGILIKNYQWKWVVWFRSILSYQLFFLITIVEHCIISGSHLKILLHYTGWDTNFGLMIEQAATKGRFALAYHVSSFGWLIQIWTVGIEMNAHISPSGWLSAWLSGVNELLTHETAALRFQLTSLSLHCVDRIGNVDRVHASGLVRFSSLHIMTSAHKWSCLVHFIRWLIAVISYIALSGSSFHLPSVFCHL